MINVVLLTDCLAELNGGAEKQIYELAKGLDKTKFKVTVVSLETYGDSDPKLIEDVGCNFKKIYVKRIYSLSGIMKGFFFKRFLCEQAVDIVMTFHFSSDIWGAFWAKQAGVKSIISNRRDMGFWRSKRHVKAYQWINRSVTRIIVNAKAIAKHISEEEGLSSNKISVIYNGIHISEIQEDNKVKELRQRLGIKEDQIVVMHVANIKPVKGHEYLIRAFANVVKEKKEAQLVLIGEDLLEGAMQSLAEELGIENYVHFLGKRKDVSELLTVSDICTLPSMSEGLSNAVMEYMLAGKPVVATNVGGNPELVLDERNGFLVEKKNAGQLSSALLKLVNDAELRVNMGKNGYQYIAQSFSITKMIEEYSRLFEDVGSFRENITSC